MSAITFGGLASGIDTNSIISQLVKLERTPIDQLSQRQNTNTTRKQKWSFLKTKLEDLKTAAAALDTAAKASPVTATSSNSAVLGVTSSSGAAGRYDVRVDRLATSSRTYSDTFASSSTTGLFGTGTIGLQVGANAPINITVDNTDTLDTVAAKINATGGGITASVLYDGSQYRLQVAGSETGLANAVSITETGVTLGISNPANVTQAAQDAQVTIDGFAITRSSNSMANVISGVSLELKDVSPGGVPQRIEVSRDNGVLQERVKKFVDAYNSVNNFINGESAYNGVNKGPETLMGDSTVRGLQARLRSQLSTPISGLTGRYTSFGSIGIALQRDGSLALDSAKLTAAIGADPNAVTQVLAKSTDGGMVAMGNLVNQYTSSTDGLIGKRMSVIDATNRQIDKQMSDLEDRVTKYEDRLRAQFTAMEKTMSRLQNQGSQITSVLNALSGANGSKNNG